MTTTPDTLTMLAAAVDKAATERAASEARRAVGEASEFLDRLGAYFPTFEARQHAHRTLDALRDALQIAAEARARDTLKHRLTEAARSALREG